MDRLADFRRRHQPGQIVRGRVLSRLSPTFAVLSIQGVQLSAAMARVPPPGHSRLFRIRTLAPDIVLQEIPPGEPTSVPVLHPAEAMNRLRALRDKLETRLAYLGVWPDANLAAQGTDIRQAFLEIVTADADATRIYEDISGTLLGTHQQQAQPDYMPWLVPAATAFECVTVGGDLTRLVCTFQDPEAGYVELSMLLGREQAAFRARTVRDAQPVTDLGPLTSALAEHALAKADGATPPAIRCLGVGRMPSRKARGAFTLLAASTPGDLDSLSFTA